jgi:hypothetical protein
MNSNSSLPIIPIYTTKGDAEAFLVYPYLYNRMGDWIGWVSPDKSVYSVLGYFVGELTNEPRITRRRFTSTLRPWKAPPPRPVHFDVPATIPLAPLMGDLRFGLVDVLQEEPERLHSLDAGELRPELD